MKLFGLPTDSTIEIDVSPGSPLPFVQYPYVMFWAAGTDTLGKVADAFTRIVRRGEEGGYEWQRQQRGGLYCLQEFKAMELQSTTFRRMLKPAAELETSLVPPSRASEPDLEEIKRYVLETKGAHDTYVREHGDCGREAGECQICTAEWEW